MLPIQVRSPYVQPPPQTGAVPAQHAAPPVEDVVEIQVSRSRLVWVGLGAAAVTAAVLLGAQAVPGPTPVATSSVSVVQTQSHRPRAYIASPLGFSDATRGYYNNTILPMVREAGFEVIDPWAGGQEITDALRIQDPVQRREALRTADLAVARRNAEDIRRADIVFAILDGTDVDSGTAAEIGYAAALGKPVFGFRGDFRLASENEGTTVNLQVEGFIIQSGGAVTRNLQDARGHLERYARSHAR